MSAWQDVVKILFAVSDRHALYPSWHQRTCNADRAGC